MKSPHEIRSDQETTRVPTERRLAQYRAVMLPHCPDCGAAYERSGEIVSRNGLEYPTQMIFPTCACAGIRAAEAIKPREHSNFAPVI